MSQKIALLKGGVVQNVIVADADWEPPEGCVKELFNPEIHELVRERIARTITPGILRSDYMNPTERLLSTAMERQYKELTADQFMTGLSDPTATLEGGSIVIASLITFGSAFVDGEEVDSSELVAALRSVGVYANMSDDDWASAETHILADDLPAYSTLRGST